MLLISKVPKYMLKSLAGKKKFKNMPEILNWLFIVLNFLFVVKGIRKNFYIFLDFIYLSCVCLESYLQFFVI